MLCGVRYLPCFTVGEYVTFDAKLIYDLEQQRYHYWYYYDPKRARFLSSDKWASNWAPMTFSIDRGKCIDRTDT